MNPWHDEIGLFAPKGTGIRSDGASDPERERAIEEDLRRAFPKDSPDQLQRRKDEILAQSGDHPATRERLIEEDLRRAYPKASADELERRKDEILGQTGDDAARERAIERSLRQAYPKASAKELEDRKKAILKEQKRNAKTNNRKANPPSDAGGPMPHLRRASNARPWSTYV